MNKCLISTLFLIPLVLMGDEELIVISEKKPFAVIVVPDKPTTAVKNASRTLQDHVYEISGIKLPIIQESGNTFFRINDEKALEFYGERSALKSVIFVGEGESVKQLGVSSSRLGPSGIKLKTIKNSLILIGADARAPNDQWGTLYATIQFLEQVLGCRYLWPGQSGKVVPKRTTVKIAPIDIEFTPKLRRRGMRSGNPKGKRNLKGLDRLNLSQNKYLEYRHRGFTPNSFSGNEKNGGWSDWHGLGGKGSIRGGHSWGYVWKKYGQEHPNWFALQPNGSRNQSRSPKRARLCLSNPNLIEALANDKIEMIKKKPFHESYPIGLNDGGQLGFCVCENCKKLDAQNRPDSLTDRVMFFSNELAKHVSKVYPDKRLVADIYGHYSAAPLLRKPHSNLYFRFARIRFTNDSKLKEDIDAYNSWKKLGIQAQFRSNFLLTFHRVGTHFIYAQKAGIYLPPILNSGVLEIDLDSIAHHWATQGLNYYVVARLLWNPDLQAKDIIDDFCTAGFGKSNMEIKQYFYRLEEISNLIAGSEIQKNKATAHYSAQIVKELNRLLRYAEKKSANDTDILTRIQFLRTGLEWTYLQASYWRLYHMFKTEGKKLTQELKQKINGVLDQIYWMAGDIAEYQPAAINVALVAWGSGACWNHSGWRPRKKDEKSDLPFILDSAIEKRE